MMGASLPALTGTPGETDQTETVALASDAPKAAKASRVTLPGWLIFPRSATTNTDGTPTLVGDIADFHHHHPQKAGVVPFHCPLP